MSSGPGPVPATVEPTGGHKTDSFQLKLCCSKAACSSEKSLKVFLSIFFASAIAITVTALIVHYPQAATAFYSVFGTTALVSLVTFAIASYRRWQGGKDTAMLSSTAEKVMHFCAIIFTISAVALTMNGLIANYPQASTAIYSIFSVAASMSFVATLVILTRKCLEERRKSTGLETNSGSPSAGGSKPNTTGGKGNAYDGNGPFVSGKDAKADG